jgi:hypothetical protein
MTPEQLKELQNLSQLFEQGLAGPDQIKQLSDLLANINNHNDLTEESVHELLSPQQTY